MRDTTSLWKGGKERYKNEKKYAPYKLFSSQLVNSVVETETNERFICKAKLCSLHDGHQNFLSRESKFDKIVDFRFNVGSPF